MDYYNEIFRRKSFHLFRGAEPISSDELDQLRFFLKTIRPLDPSIATEIRIVPERETTCHRGADYCIELYSEEKGNYLRNIGYIGEQIDLYLTSKNIGTLWFGIGKPDEKSIGSLSFVIMIAIARMPADKFRKDMFKAKRKPIEEIWSGNTLNIAQIARFTPSACNTQPWYTENQGNTLRVYRYKKPGKRGIMPAAMVSFYNRIDIGIYLFILETCLKQEGYSFEAKQYEDPLTDNEEYTLSAEYTYFKGGSEL